MRDQLLAAVEGIEVGDREIRAFVPEPDRRRRLLADADAMEELFDHGDPPPLLGTLVAVKDIIHVDGLPTRAGSDVPPELFAGSEATIVRRLRGAGALIAGKTTTTEFAFSEPGPTRNPRDLTRTPGGSSSGSAAAVADGLIPLALGTQGVDSVVTPAAYCGVVGFKPTYLRMPIDGIVPFAPSMDHAGLFANDVASAQLAASVVCDDWNLKPTAPDLVLGIPDAAFTDRAQPGAVQVVEAVVELLRREGFDVVETSALADIEAIAATHRRLIAAEFAGVHKEWFSRYGDRYRSRTAGLVAEGAALPESAVGAGRESGAVLQQSLDDLMRREGIEAFVSPATTDVAPVGLDFIGDPIMGVAWTHAHVPVVTLPVGLSPTSLPLGIQLAGRPGGDEELLSLAHVAETAIESGGLSLEP